MEGDRGKVTRTGSQNLWGLFSLLYRNFDTDVPRRAQAHPVNGPSVCYTHIELTNNGPVWFTIRWWDGDDVRTFFDLVDVSDKTRVLCPRRDLPDLEIEVRYLGAMFKLKTLEEEIHRSHGASESPFNGEERYAAPPGARACIYRKDPTNNGHRQHIANVYVPVSGLSQPELGLWPQTILYGRR